MQEANILTSIDDVINTIPKGDRSGEVIEPLLKDQWFLDVKGMAERSIKAVEDELPRSLPQDSLHERKTRTVIFGKYWENNCY